MLINNQNATAVYLYGFTLPGAVLPMVLGVDDIHPLASHTSSGLTAIISTVALADFTGEVGEENLQNLAWLTPRACRHSLVIEQCMTQAAVYPVSFGTLFSNLSALEQEMCRLAEDVLAMLQHIANCEEWALEARLERKQAVEALFAEGLQSGRFSLPESAGRRHLEEQKLRRQLNNELNDWLVEHLNTWQNQLSILARDFRQRRLADDKILHWAYLLPVANVAAFQEHIDKLSNHYVDYGFSFRVTGPWAAYSFCQPAPT